MNKLIQTIFFAVVLLGVHQTVNGFPQKFFGIGFPSSNIFFQNDNQKTYQPPLNVQIKPSAPVDSVFNLFVKTNAPTNQEIKPIKNNENIFQTTTGVSPKVNKRFNEAVATNGNVIQANTIDNKSKIVENKDNKKIIDNTIPKQQTEKPFDILDFAIFTSPNPDNSTEFTTETTDEFETTTADDNELDVRVSSQYVVATLLG